MADNITLKDGLGNLLVMRTTNAAGINTSHTIIDGLPSLPAGVANIGRTTPQIADEDVSQTNPMPVMVPMGVDVISLPELPQGGNHIGHVTIQNGGVDVSGMNPFPVQITGTGGIPLEISNSLPAGVNTIGKVIIDTLPALPAGTAVIGKVVQQVGGSDISNSNPLPVTVAGGSLPVTVSSSLPAGTNNIGYVSIQSLPALPAGTASIGKVALQVASADVSSANPIPVTMTGPAISATITGSLQAGTNNIGKVSVQVGGNDVDNTHPLPVSLASGAITSLPALAAGTNTIGKVALQVATADVTDVNPIPVKTTMPLPAGTNVIGKVAHQVGGSDLSDINPMPVAVTQADISIEFDGGLPAGNNTLGRIILEADGADVSEATPLPVAVITQAALPAGGNAIGKVTLQVDGSDVGDVVPLHTRGQRGSISDASGAVATGGLSQSVLAQQNGRRFFFFQNLSSDDLFLNFGNAAAPTSNSIKIGPDGAFSMDAGFVSTDQIFVFGATTGQQYVIKWA